MATQQKNIQVIDSLYNGFSTGDTPTVLGLMHPKIEWNEAESNSLADGNPYIGPDAILEGVFARLGTNHEYFGLQDVKIHGMNDNMVLATLRYDAKVKKMVRPIMHKSHIYGHLMTKEKLFYFSNMRIPRNWQIQKCSWNCDD